MPTGSNQPHKIALEPTEIVRRLSDGETMMDIARSMGISNAPIRRLLREQGVRIADLPRPPSRQKGANNARWKGGAPYRRADGYILIFADGRRRLEHRVVMERTLGRPLRVGEVVHHKDGDRANNSPSNLQVTTQSLHSTNHQAEVRDPLLLEGKKRCTICGDVKLLADFPAAARSRFRQSWCRVCKNARDSAKKKECRLALR